MHQLFSLTMSPPLTLNLLLAENILNVTGWNWRKGWLKASLAVSLFCGSVTKSLLIYTHTHRRTDKTTVTGDTLSKYRSLLYQPAADYSTGGGTKVNKVDQSKQITQAVRSKSGRGLRPYTTLPPTAVCLRLNNWLHFLYVLKPKP